MPKVSVIVAAYNVEDYIEEALHSLINQTLEDVEFIIVDDGSTDNTVEILNQWRAIDTRFKIIRNSKNFGPLISRKLGSEAASGEYLMFLDGDDALNFNACEKAYKAIKKNGTDIMQFNTNIVINTKVDQKCNSEVANVYSYLRSPEMKIFSISKAGLLGAKQGAYINFTIWNKIYKKSLISAVNKCIPDKRLLIAEDVLFSYITCFLAKSFSFLKESLYNYKFGTGISTATKISNSKLEAVGTSYFVYNYLSEWTKQNGATKICKYRLDEIKMQLLNNIAHILLKICPEEKRNYFTELVLEHCPVEEFISIISYASHCQDIVQPGTSAELCSDLKIFKTKNTEKKTIGVFYFRMNNGGVENVISKLTDMWIKNGYSVVLFTDQPKNDDDYYINPKIKRIVLPEYIYGNYESFIKRTREFRTALIKYSVNIMVYNAWASPFLVYDALIVKSLGISFISHTHGVSCFDFASINSASAFINTTLPKMYSLCNSVVTLTETDQVYWKSFGLNAVQTTNPSVIPIDTKVSDLKSNNIVMVCRISQEKQVLDAIKIVEQVSLKIPDVTFTVVGGGDECYKNDLTNYIKEHKLGDIVKMVGFKKNVLPYYQSADVMLITSKFEGFCLSLLESKICGLPLVMYSLPNLDTVRDAKGMLVVPQNDIDSAAEKIIEILSDGTLKKQLGKEARESAEEILGIDLAKHWDYIFEKTLNPDTREIKLTPEQSAINTLVHYTGQGILARMYTQPQVQYQQIPLEVPNEDWLRQSHYADSLEATIKEIRNSTSYKLGWFLTTIPRKIKDYIKGQKYVE